MSTLNVLCDTRCIENYEPLSHFTSLRTKKKNSGSYVVKSFTCTCAMRMTEYNHVPIVDKYRQEVKVFIDIIRIDKNELLHIIKDSLNLTLFQVAYALRYIRDSCQLFRVKQ